MPSCLVALDIDGTVLDHDYSLPAGHHRAISELTAAGVQVALITGRPLHTTRWVHQALRLRTPLACFNGAWVGLQNGQHVASSLLNEAEVREIVATLADEGGSICCYPRVDALVMDQVTPLTARWNHIYQTTIDVDRERVHDWRGTSYKLMLVVEPERLDDAVRRFRARFASRFHAVVSHIDRFEISRPGVTKAWGLKHLAAHLGVARERVWAVGDAANDAEMIGWAGHGCAMGQASEGLRRMARHVLPGVSARGLCALPSLLARFHD
jgi:Cof subfamily protein (haloacid dehalogenase superfamily)